MVSNHLHHGRPNHHDRRPDEKDARRPYDHHYRRPDEKDARRPYDHHYRRPDDYDDYAAAC
jgi:hypothetical protein